MLTMICGIPNAGKTTFSKRYENALHLDDIGTIDRVVETISGMDGDVIIEGYFGKKESRDRVRAAHKGRSRCIFLDVSIEESIRREDRNRHSQILRNAERFFEPPTYSEGWDEIIIIEENNVESISDKIKT